MDHCACFAQQDGEGPSSENACSGPESDEPSGVTDPLAGDLLPQPYVGPVPLQGEYPTIV
eukprot:4659685-Pyramimonas_sp.AAC.1